MLSVFSKNVSHLPKTFIFNTQSCEKNSVITRLVHKLHKECKFVWVKRQDCRLSTANAVQQVHQL